MERNGTERERTPQLSLTWSWELGGMRLPVVVLSPGGTLLSARNYHRKLCPKLGKRWEKCKSCTGFYENELRLSRE